MKTLAKIFNSLTVCAMSGIGCVPMAANFSINSNKSFSITAKHNSLTNQQLKDESGIDVDDYQSMIKKYIDENSKKIDDMATSWLNKNDKDGKTQYIRINEKNLSRAILVAKDVKEKK